MRRVAIGIIMAIHVLVSVSLDAFATAGSQPFQPKANSAAIVQLDRARFTILTPRVIRMEWSETATFEDRASLTFINRNLPVPPFTRRNTGGWVELATEALTLRYQPSPLGFTSDNLLVEFKADGLIRTWTFGMPDTANLRGTTGSLDSTEGSHWLDGDKRVPILLEPGLLSREGWTVIDDSARPLFDNSEWPWVIERTTQPGYHDLYFFAYGLDYKAALGDFVKIAGPIPLPPRFAFGYWYSRWWPYTELELREIVSHFQNLDIPMDVLVMDMDWHLTNLSQFFKDGARSKDLAGEDAGWTGFTWDHNLFSEPTDFLKWSDDQNLKISLNLHPASGIQPHEEQYAAMARVMAVDPAGGNQIPFDILNKTWAKNFLDLIIHPMERNGVDFWWLDWQAWSTTNMTGVNPIFYLNYVFFSDMERQGLHRPLIYHRWGGLGNHRYQIGFSGDTSISWATLAYQTYFTANAANVGFGYWGNDIGGFRGSSDNDPELFTRWFQFGVFSPILKTHATSNSEIKRKFWEYPFETFLSLRGLVHLRYALLPYIYTAARTAYDTGVSISRPMYYDNPQDDQAYRRPTQYMFGEQMLVSPVVEAMPKEALHTWRETWLPKGRWYEWTSGSTIEGDRVVSRPITVEEVPVYLKDGAIVPMHPKMRNTSERPVDPLILAIFPGQHGKATVYEDEGDTSGYRQDQYAITRASFTRQQDVVRITIDPAEGTYPGMPVRRSYQVRLVHMLPPTSVTINGKPVDFSAESRAGTWRYEGPDLATWITTPEVGIRERVEIELTSPSSGDELLNGKVALMRRLYTFAKFLGGQRNFRKQDKWSDAKHPSGIVTRAAQTGLRLSKRPDTAIDELRGLDLAVSQIIAMLTEVTKNQPDFLPYLKLLEVTVTSP